MGRWQAIFSQESWRIARKNCAVQGAKDPPVGHVGIFQTSPKPYQQMTYPGQRIQVDVKVVPRRCIADPELRL